LALHREHGAVGTPRDPRSVGRQRDAERFIGAAREPLYPPACALTVEQSVPRSRDRVNLQDNFVRLREHRVRGGRLQPPRKGRDRQRKRPTQPGTKIREEPGIRRQPCRATIVVDLDPRDYLPGPAPLTDEGADMGERRLLVPVLELTVDAYDQDDRSPAAGERRLIHRDGLETAAPVGSGRE